MMIYLMSLVIIFIKFSYSINNDFVQSFSIGNKNY